MTAPARDERAVDDDGLALDVAADEIRARADADPDGLGGDPLRSVWPSCRTPGKTVARSIVLPSAVL